MIRAIRRSTFMARSSRSQTVSFPARLWASARLTVRLLMIDFDQERTQPRIEFRQRENWFHCRGARWCVARLMAQEELVDRLEDPLDLPSAARFASNREHEGHMQVSCHLREVVRWTIVAAAA
jgi:hypothetical protein